MGYSINSSIGSTTSSTRRSPKKVVAAILTGAMLSIVALAPAAHAADTTTTFELEGGSLIIDSPETANLGTADTGDDSLDGSLGENTVTDARGVTLGWVANVSSSSFVGSTGTTILASQAAYAPGDVSSDGIVTATAGDGGAMAAPQLAVTATEASGNNTATWTPQVTVTLPAEALAGVYTATITHSVA